MAFGGLILLSGQIRSTKLDLNRDIHNDVIGLVQSAQAHYLIIPLQCICIIH